MLNSQTQSQSAMSILGYVPALVVQHLLNIKTNKLPRQLPEKQTIKSVVMFADISGFTKLTEKLSQLGTEGAERIAFAINRYMELLVQGIGRSGGDIFKFAGDAMIVLWPPPVEDEKFQDNLETLLKQAIQSALFLQEKLTKTTIEQGIQLSVKIGFGVGELNIIHVGGIFARTEYLATGDPLIQAFSSEHCLTEGGKIIISSQVHGMIGNFFECRPVDKHPGFYQVISLQLNQAKVKMKADALLIKNNLTLSKFNLIKNEINSYIPAALLPYIEINEEAWSAELRRLTILFVNLSIDLSDAKTDKGLGHIQRVIQTVQKCIYMHEGSLNKLLMDDKGSTLIVVFGLPPLSHQNDSVRAILTAQLMRQELPKISCSCSIGIVTGTVFAGVVGTSGSRREYSVLGDSVNLAARLMQAACEESVQKILLCSETAKSSEHHISTVFFKKQSVKGKNEPVFIYVPLDKPLEPVATNLFPNFRTHAYAYGFQKQTDFKDIQLFGREEQYKQILNLIDRNMRGVDKKYFLVVKGAYGIGKSILVKKVLHRVQEKVIGNQYNPWKYGELPQVIISQLDPITRSYRLNGIRQILQQIFALYSKRVERPTDMALFKMMVDESKFREETVILLQEILGLREMNKVQNFPQKTNDDEDFGDIKKIIFQFLSNYFEQIPIKYKELYDGRSPEEIGWDIKGSVNRVTVKYSIKYSNIIAPMVIALDDCQNYDSMSFKILQMMIKHYDRMLLIALYRDVFQELTFQPKNVEKKKQQEEIAMDGIALLEDAIETNQYSIIHLRGIEKKNKDDELAKMIRFSFNIHKFVAEIELQSLNNNESIYQPQFEEIRGRGNTAIIDVQGQENYNKELNHPFLFYENKQKLLEKDVELLLLQYIYLKTGGNPLNVLNLMQCLIDQDYIKLGSKFATLTNEMINLINYEESIVLDVPCCRIEVNGPIIDKLTCLEQLILKVSSVIGDIFDVQTLNKINPFKVAVNNKLQKIMDDLEQKDLIEVMEVQEQNIYYRFTHPFMRDTLYQRITFKQRRQLHKGTAEAIQVLPIAFETEELVQSKKLQFNWLMAEQTNQIDQSLEKNNIIPQTTFIKSFLFKATFGLAGQRRHNYSQQAILEDQKQKQFENMSSKALRSIILKQISNKLTMNNNNQNTILKEGVLEKKSKQNVTWAPRYFIIDGKEFRCYYNKQDFIKGEPPLCTIPLKGIYSVMALDERQYTEVKYPFQLSSTIWYKKNKELGDRKFFFNAKNAEELEMWTIYLEFAKAKAIYDDFTNNFGKISFPIGNQSDYFDSEFKYDISIDNKRMNLGSALDKNGSKSRGSMVARNSRVSKFTLATKQFKFMEKSQFEDNTLQQSQVMDGQMLKDRVHCFLQKGMLLLFSHIFDMSLQKEEDYKLIGTSNLVMRKLNNIFKVDRSLLADNKKGSSTFMMDKSSILSPNHDQLNSRKLLNLDNFNIGIKKADDSDNESDSFSSLKDVSNKQKTLELIKEEDEMVEEQSVKLSESTLLKQQYLKQQRLQNQKFSFGDDSFTKMQNHLRVPSPLNSAHKNDEKSKDSNTHKQSESRGSQESFEQNQAQQVKRRNTERQEYQQVKSMNYFPKAQANIALNTQQNLNPKEEKDNLKIIINEIPNVEQQDVGIQVNQQTKQELQNFNKSISKSSIEQKSESSSKDDQQNNNQELNILQLLDRESPKYPKNMKVGNPSSKNLDEHGKRDTISQYFPRGSHISSSHFQSTQNQITQQFNAQSTQQSTQLLNYKPKLIAQYLSRQSNISQKTLPNTGGVYSSKQLNSPHKSSDNLAIYATAINTSKSLSGDLFTLRPGTRVIVNKVDKQKQLVQCTYQNMTGLFYLRDIAVLDEPQMETDIPVKSRTPSAFENRYKQLLNDRFNHTSRSPNYKHSLTKSKTPTRVTNRKTLIL